MYPFSQNNPSSDDSFDANLHAVKQRFSYFSQEAKSLRKKGHFAPMVAPKGMRTACRLRPRQVLCSVCSAVCNDKKENLGKTKQLLSDKDPKSNTNISETESSADSNRLKPGDKTKRKLCELESKGSLVPKVKRLKQEEILKSNGYNISNCSKARVEKDKENRVDTVKKVGPSKEAGNNRIRKTRSSVSAEELVNVSNAKKKKRDPSHSLDTAITSLTKGVNNTGDNIALTSECLHKPASNDTPALPKLTISPTGVKIINNLEVKDIDKPKEEEKSLSTPTLKIFIDSDGMGRVLKAPNKDDESQSINLNHSKPNCSTPSLKVAEKRIKKKSHKRAFFLRNNSSVGGDTSPLRSFNGRLGCASPSRLSSPNRVGYLFPFETETQ